MILTFTISLLAIAGFGFVLWHSRILSIIKETMHATMAGLSAMMDNELDDNAKERAVRTAGFILLRASFRISWRLFLVLGAALTPILLADFVGLMPRNSVFLLMLRLDYIIIVSVALIVLTRVFGRRRRVADLPEGHANHYSTVDKFFHVLAFSHPLVLKIASQIEDRLFSRSTKAASAPPIFITSLARGGTTALLNAMHDVPGIATHTYRDMPFLTAPSLWNRLVGGKKRNVKRHQRAHGDGLEIDLDSPEALEEVIWKMFWPQKFQGAAIAVWTPKDRNPEADQFLKRNMEKIIRFRQEGDKTDTPAIYCSKNNANIARITYLTDTFPDCRIVIPVRRPECHAASLLRQHINFLKQHADDDFTRQYMRDIGHFEFGQLHKPLHFSDCNSAHYAPTTADYWLQYWVRTFRYILQHNVGCVFVLQDDLRAAPQATMEALCTALDLSRGAMTFDSYFRLGKDQSPTDVYDQSLYAEASEIYCNIAQMGSLKTIKPNIIATVVPVLR